MRRAACVVALSLLVLAGCGTQQPRVNRTAAHVPVSAPAPAPMPSPHPQAVEPVAGAGAAAASPAQPQDQEQPQQPPVVSVEQGNGPAEPNASLAQPLTDAQVRQELAQAGAANATSGGGRATLTANGLAIPPADAPPVVQEVIEAGNQIAHLPYVWGGGHGTFVDTGYDCSGSISFTFEAAGLLSGPVVSGDLMNWGDPGPGKWITVFANQGHTFMYVAGLRFDTVALAETGSRWSNTPANEPDLGSFAVRHPPGL